MNIDDNNRLEKLEIHLGQDANQVIEKFCSDFDIPEIKKERLQKIVEERLSNK